MSYHLFFCRHRLQRTLTSAAVILFMQLPSFHPPFSSCISIQKCISTKVHVFYAPAKCTCINAFTQCRKYVHTYYAYYYLIPVHVRTLAYTCTYYILHNYGISGISCTALGDCCSIARYSSGNDKRKSTKNH